MEAADDISYGLADIEDAVEKGVLNVEQVIAGLRSEFTDLGGNLDDTVVAYCRTTSAA